MLSLYMVDRRRSRVRPLDPAGVAGTVLRLRSPAGAAVSDDRAGDAAGSLGAVGDLRRGAAVSADCTAGPTSTATATGRYVHIPPFHVLKFSNCLSIQVVLLQSAPTITAAAPATPAVVQLTPSYSTVSVQQQADVGFVSADDPDGNTFHYHVHVANLDDAAGVQDAINDYGQPQQIQAAPVRPVYRPKKQR